MILMDTFWHWLMKANARAVLLIAILVLLLVSGWWFWQELHPPKRAELTDLPLPERSELRPLGLLAMVDQQLALGRPEVPDTPFRPYEQTRRIPALIPSTLPDAPDVPVAVDSTDPGRTRPVRPIPSSIRPRFPRRPPGPNEVALVYRGLLRTTDGHLRAFVLDSKSGRARFYRQGDELGPYRVGESTSEALILYDSANEAVTISFGDQLTYTEETP